MKTKSMLAAFVAAVFGTMMFAAPAMAGGDYGHHNPPPTCTPHAAYDETVIDHEAYVIHHDAVTHVETVVDHEAYDETVIDTEAVNKWYSWTGGPSDTHPAPPAGSWQVDNGNHNGFDQSPGLLQRDKGNSGESDWFYHVVIAEKSHIVHHDAITHPVTVVDHEAYDETVPAVTHVVHHDAVVCPPPGGDEPRLVVPGMPVLKDLCGIEHDHYGLLEPTADIIYSNGPNKVIIATLVAGQNIAWGTLPTGWVANSNTTAIFAFNAALFTNVPCVPDTEIVPIPTVFSTQPSAPNCDVDGALPDFGSNFPNVTFAITPAFTGPGDYTVTVTPKTGFAFNPANLPAGWAYNAATGAASRVLTVLPKLTGSQCDEDLIPVTPDVTYETSCEDGYPVVDFDGVPVEHITYSYDGERYLTATADEGYMIVTDPNGLFAINEDGTATFDAESVLTGEECDNELTPTGIPFSAPTPAPSCTAPATFNAASLGGVFDAESGRWDFPNVSVEVVTSVPGQVTLNVFANEGFVIDASLVPAGWFVEAGGARASRTITLAPATGTQSTNPMAACYTAPSVTPPGGTPTTVTTVVRTVPSTGAVLATQRTFYSNGVLASTGSNGILGLGALAALLLVIGGSAATVAARRK